MTDHAASRLVLVAEGRPRLPQPQERVRRYRFARVRIAEQREPRPLFAHLARPHD